MGEEDRAFIVQERDYPFYPLLWHRTKRCWTQIGDETNLPFASVDAAARAKDRLQREGAIPTKDGDDLSRNEVSAMAICEIARQFASLLSTLDAVNKWAEQ